MPLPALRAPRHDGLASRLLVNAGLPEALAYTLTNPQDTLALFQKEVPGMALNPGAKEFARITAESAKPRISGQRISHPMASDIPNAFMTASIIRRPQVST